MGKKIMIIGAGEFQLPAILKAKEMNLDVLATDRDTNAPGFKYADFTEVVDVKDEERNIAVARKHRINGVITIACEAGVRSAAAVAQTFGLPGLTPEISFKVTNKLAMRKVFKKHSLPSPEFRAIKTLKEAVEAIGSLKLPVVMKPADNSGSRGVSRIGNINELDFSYHWAKENSLSGDIIVENFLKGTEMTVESISYQGKHNILAMSSKNHILFPFCVATGLIYPPSYNEEILDSVRLLIARALDALGVYSGASHSEVMMTDKGPYLIEVAARGGGFGIFSDIVPFVTGVDIVKQCINIAMGFDVDIKATCQKASVLRFFNPPLGKIIKISGLEKARKIPGVFKIKLGKKVGDNFTQIRWDGERPGFIMTFSDNREEAIERADLVEKTVKFDVMGEG